ncbi:MAG: RidA family protein [Synergistales bacterium]|nr:RidA family protein [Synergistales bacterium]
MKKAIHTDKAPKALGPYSQAIDGGDAVFLSGQIGIDPASGKFVEGVEAQARQALKNIGNVLAEAGLSLENVVKTTIFLTDIGDFAAVNAVYASFFAEPYPARSCLQVMALPGGALVEIEVLARR